MKKLQHLMINIILLAFVLTASIHTARTPALAQDAAAYYKGKTITFIVPFTPGGGYDTNARLVAPYLAEQTGGKVVIRNMPGGNTYIAMNHTYRAKPNGLTLLLANGPVSVTNQMIAAPEAKGIDIRKFEWLCRITSEPGVLMLGVKSGFKSVDDLKAAKKVLKFGSTGRGNRGSLGVSVLLEILGLNGKIVVGFKGNSVVALAVMRGELDGFVSSTTFATDLMKQPDIFALCYMSAKKSPLIPELPTIGELVALNPQQKQWIERLDLLQGAGRFVVTTPGTPRGRVQFLRNAFRKALQNEQLLAMAKKIRRYVDYAPGEEAKKDADKILGLPEREIEKITYVTFEKYH